MSYNLPPPNLLQYINLYNPFASGRFLQPLDNLKYDNQGNFGGQHFLSPWFDIHQSPQTKVDSESSISKNPSRICFPVCSPEFIDEAWWTTNCAWVPPTLILASTASSSLSVSGLAALLSKINVGLAFFQWSYIPYITPGSRVHSNSPLIFVGSLWILLRVPGFSMSNESDTRPRISWWLVMDRSEVNQCPR